MKIIFSFFFILVFIYSCSMFKTEKVVKIPKIIFSNDRIINLEIKADLNIEMPEMNNSVNSTISLIEKDSLLMNIYGPFGIQIAKLFSSNKEFVFYNMFQNQIISGTPSKENFLKATNLNLSFDELIHLIRNEVPGKNENFQYYKNDENSNEIYKNKLDNNKIFVTYDNKYKKLIKYEQKDNLDNKLLSINYKDYSPYNNFLLPNTIEIIFEKLSGKLTINVEEYKINGEINSINFDKPTSAKIIKLD